MATKDKLDLLTAIEHIVENAQNSGLSKEFYRKTDKYIKYVSEKLDLTKEQSVMMALFIDNSNDSCIYISDFGKFLGCRTTRILKYTTDIDVLEKRELIRCSREVRRSGGGYSYSVPMEVIEAFKHDEKFVPKDYSGLSCMDFFSELETIFEMRNHDELTYEATVDKVMQLLESNPQLLIVQQLKSYDMEVLDTMILLVFLHLFVNENDDSIGFYDLDFLLDNRRNWNMVKMKMSRGNSNLQQEKLIDYDNDDGMADRSSFHLTFKAKSELLGELNLSLVTQKRGDMLKWEEITPKKMFYGEKEKAQIDELTQLLDDEKYNQIRTRMKDTGFRCGFTCLFYGAPGTGKTETVLQLARQTGRDILQVNISQIKSMWVGESEKNIKQVFDHYRARVKESKKTPILLFNEADAIIGKRQVGAERAVEKMENSIQNIILQEMETLDGILIATTNLAQNMDKAFERRFLYKIKFEKPTVEARMHIWHEMIPNLCEKDVRTLASQYDFSGGQIENIARHYTIGNILHGDSSNVIEKLSGYCNNEKLERSHHRIIGFGG